MKEGSDGNSEKGEVAIKVFSDTLKATEGKKPRKRQLYCS